MIQSNQVKPASIVVDMKVSETSDALYLTPREPAEGSILVKIIKEFLPKGAITRRTVEGIRIPTRYGTQIVDGVEGLDINLNVETIRFLANRDRANGYYTRLLKDLSEIKLHGVNLARSLITDSDGLDVLDPHQIVNVAAMTLAGGFGLCVFDEQGAGKTVTLIYAFDLLVSRDEADAALIVAPKSMITEWKKDFERFRLDLYRVVIVSGTKRERNVALNSGADVLITNFETVVSMEAELKALFRSHGRRYVLTIDESFFIKSIDAKRTKALRRLREWCDRAYVLCGTPAPNSPRDLEQQFSIVDFGMAFDGKYIPDDREAAGKVIQKTIETRGLYVRHLKSEVLPELPAKRFHRAFVTMEPVQRQIYSDALQSLLHDVEGITDEDFRRRLSNFAARRAALLQICSNPIAVINGYTEIPAKLATLDELFQELIEKQQEKVIVWSFYTKSITALCERYQQYGVLRYDGLVSDVRERRESVRRFQEDDKAMLFIANPAAAGAGLTLHRARYSVYESFSNQAAHYLQSLDRTHRRGQMRDVEYLILLCEDTLEVQEYDRLLNKEKTAQDLLGDRVDTPISRTSFLSDLRTASGLLGQNNQQPYTINGEG